MRKRSSQSTNGSRTIAGSGNSASIASTIICANCRRRTAERERENQRRRNMAAPRSKVADRALMLERIFDAPIDLVWRCWTEKEHLAQWSRPRGFTFQKSDSDLQL